MLEIRDALPGGCFAQIFRVKTTPDGAFDFIMPTKVR